MTVAELMEQLEDVDPNIEIKLALQPNYPMTGSIRNICLEYDSENSQKRLWIACSGNEGYGCPREAWSDSEIYEDSDEDNE